MNRRRDTTLVARNGRDDGFGSLNDAAVPQAGQYGFAIGRWRYITTVLLAGGDSMTLPEGEWVFRYVLGGLAVQDEYWQPMESGQSMCGTSLRCYDEAAGKWLHQGLDDYLAGPVQSTAVGQWVEGQMVVIGGAGRDDQCRDYIDRNVFFDASDNGWRWRKDRSYDDQASWTEIATVEAWRL